MPIYPIKTRLFDGNIDPDLLFYIDAKYNNSYSGGNTVNNLASVNAESLVSTGNLVGVIFDNEENGCFKFDGSNSYLSFPTNTYVFNSLDNLSFSIYLKPEGPGIVIPFSAEWILQNYISGGSSFGISWKLNKFGYGGSNYSRESDEYPENKWYHICFTKEFVGDPQPNLQVKYKFYVNGILQYEGRGRTSGNTYAPFSIGTNFIGKISDFKIYKKTLTANEVYNDFTTSQIKPYTLGTKKVSSDIILYLNEKGTSSGWGDNSMYSNGGLLVGNAIFDKGLILPGLDSQNYAQGTLTVSPNQNYTISAVVTSTGTSTTGFQTIISIDGASQNFNSLGSSSPSVGIIFNLKDSDKRILLTYLNTSAVQTDANTWTVGETFHVGVTIQESGGDRIIRIYKNGNLIKTQTVTLNFSWGSVIRYRVGYWGTGYRHPFNGKISNVVMYNRQLSNQEMQNLSKQLPTTYKSNESLINQAPNASKILYVDGGEPRSYYLTGTSVRDLSGYGRNGTFSTDNSGSLPTFKTLNGGYFNFTGPKVGAIGNSYIKFTPTDLPSGNSPSTIITWARLKKTPGVSVIFSYGLDTTINSRTIGLLSNNDNSIYAYSFVDRFRGITSSVGTIQLNEWFQLTQVMDGQRNYIYINGVLNISESRVAATVVTNVLSEARLGSSIYSTSGNYSGYFNGDIAEVTIYNRALDPQEIYQDYKVKRYRYGLQLVDRPIDNSVPTVPDVSTIAVTSITPTTALSGVQINSTGGSNIIESGIIWSLSSSNLTIDLTTKTTDGSGQITNLTPGQTYYVLAYARNSIGIGYANNVESFVAANVTLPVVTSVSATSTNATTIVATGSVTDLGGASQVTGRGFVYNTTTFTEAQAVNINTRVDIGTGGLGEYKTTINNLSNDTLYFLRAFAINSAGTDYSANILSLRTLALGTITITIPTATITGTSFVVNVTTTGTNISTQGVIWKTDTSDPDIASDQDIEQPGPAGTYQFTVNPSSPALQPNTTYYVWGYVVNNAGTRFTTTFTTVVTDSVPSVSTDEVLATNEATFQGTLNNTNGSPVTVIGFIWGRKSVYTNPDTLTITSNDGSYSETDLSGNTYVNNYSFSATGDASILPQQAYWVKARATNAVGTAYGTAIEFILIGPPNVTTVDATVDINNSLIYILQGNLTDLGGTLNTQVGFRLGTTNPPTTEFIVGTLESVDTFNYTTAQLTPGTYFYQAFANNLYLVDTGQVKSFVVVNTNIPTISTSYPTDTILSTGNGTLVMTMEATSITNNPTSRGFVWQQSIGPEDSLQTKTSNSTGNTNFSAIVPTDAPANFNTMQSKQDYFIRAYARNSSGVGYSNNIRVFVESFDLNEPQVINNKLLYSAQLSTPVITNNVNAGAVWSTTQITQARLKTPDATLYSSDGVGAAVTSSWGYNSTGSLDGNGILTTAVDGETYYVRAWVQLGANYGNMKIYSRERSITYTTDTAPVVTFNQVLGAGGNFISVNANITNNGGQNILERGFYYSTTSPVTLSSTKKTTLGFTSQTGVYQDDITGLLPGGTYFIRAFARNSIGTTLSTNEGSSNTLRIIFNQSTQANLDPFGGNPSDLSDGRISDPLYQSGDILTVGPQINIGFDFASSDVSGSSIDIYASSVTSTPTNTNYTDTRQVITGANFNVVRYNFQVGSPGAGRTWYFRVGYNSTSAGGLLRYSNVVSLYLPALYSVFVESLQVGQFTVQGRIDLTNAGTITIQEKGYYFSNISVTNNGFDPYFNTSNRTKVVVAGTTPGYWTNTRTGLTSGVLYSVAAYVILSNGQTYWSDPYGVFVN